MIRRYFCTCDPVFIKFHEKIESRVTVSQGNALSLGTLIRILLEKNTHD